MMVVGVKGPRGRRYYLPDTLTVREVVQFLEDIGGGHLKHRMTAGTIEIIQEDPLHGVVDYVE